MDLRSPLGKVKGLGSAKSGSGTWLAMRIAALALIPLTIWFVSLVIRASTGDQSLISFLKNPFEAVAMILFMGVALYHGCLGIKEVIEDYVHCHCAKLFLVITLKFVTIITAVFVILAVIQVHINGGVPRITDTATAQAGSAADVRGEMGELYKMFKEQGSRVSE
jgi:succinate dehydrogenase / fumarate reductase membrane anchor subunit